jgi:hypothetical protein
MLAYKKFRKVHLFLRSVVTNFGCPELAESDKIVEEAMRIPLKRNLSAFLAFAVDRYFIFPPSSSSLPSLLLTPFSPPQATEECGDDERSKKVRHRDSSILWRHEFRQRRGCWTGLLQNHV